MKAHLISTTLAAALLAGVSHGALAEPVFNRIATFHVVDNLPSGADPKTGTVAEIISATADGMTLVYTDSPGQRIGFVDIKDPAAPKAGGIVALGGEPTSVVVTSGTALVGVVTSESKAKPSGHLAVVDLAGRTVVARCDLGGQPDSLAKSRDGKRLAIAIENERDEEVNEGAIPQLPGGDVKLFDIAADGTVDCVTMKSVALTGLATIAPEDPEPEFVDFNSRDDVAVTLQENNHIAIIDAASGKVTANFSAGTVEVHGVDTKKDGIIDQTATAKSAPREPDAVQWLDDERFVIANEGDMDGGTRGFSILRKDGTVEYDSGAFLDRLAARLGHYPEARNKKGVEPEGAEVATFGSDRLIFIGMERASLVAVFRDEGAGKAPTYLEALPGGIGPEGLLAIPSRNLFVTASETDLREDGLIGSVVTVYQRGEGEVAYPTIASAVDDTGKPIAWGALSGAVADRAAPGRLFLVTDSAYAHASILTLDTTKAPAEITKALVVTKDGKPAEDLDIEGVAVAADGGFWLASEGNPEREKNPTQSKLLRTDASGAVVEEIALPESLASQATRFGFEGVAVTGSGDGETVWIAVQREWKDDPKGMAKILAYRPAAKEWGAVHYPLDASETGWVGLSEITVLDDGHLVVIERDNQIGRDAKVKRLMVVPISGVTPAQLGSGSIPVVSKTLLRDLLPDLAKPNGYVLDKVESFAVDANGDGFVITDNDGVKDHSGETQFFRLGRVNLPM